MFGTYVNTTSPTFYLGGAKTGPVLVSRNNRSALVENTKDMMFRFHIH